MTLLITKFCRVETPTTDNACPGINTLNNQISEMIKGENDLTQLAGYLIMLKDQVDNLEARIVTLVNKKLEEDNLPIKITGPVI
jgi:hypothetical protein